MSTHAKEILPILGRGGVSRPEHTSSPLLHCSLSINASVTAQETLVQCFISVTGVVHHSFIRLVKEANNLMFMLKYTKYCKF